MTVLILLAFGMALLIFALSFSKRHEQSYHNLMQHNKDVQPLFKERSANAKHEQLLVTFKNNVPALKELIELQNSFTDKLIDAAEYETALDGLALKYKGE